MVEGAPDAFESRLVASDTDVFKKQLEALKNDEIHTSFQKHPTLGRTTTIVTETPGTRKRSFDDFTQDVGLLDLKKRLVDPAEKHLQKLSNLQRSLAPSLLTYRDVLFGARTPQNADELRNLTVLHALNHLFKTRDRIIKNNAKLRGLDDAESPEKDLRDQGFTRPKILIVLETRQQCTKWVDAILKLSDPDQQENKKRFQDTFSGEEGKFGDEKPLDFRDVFEGNDDDDFRIGLKFTRRTVKFFSHFYSSDVILASPVGIRRAIKADDPKEMDCDFLSSIEICIIDQADAMLMQNWEHVEFVFDHLNRQPQNAHGCDFSRVRQRYLDGNAKYLRQTLVFSQYITPELNSLFSQHMQNVEGKIKIQPEYRGVMQDMEFQVRQTFNRISSRAPGSDPEERFKYFTNIIVPSILHLPQPSEGGIGALVFIPNYYDYVRVRNYFASDQSTQDLSFGTFSEYDAPNVSQRARSHFDSGKHSVLLYTGRAHHFRRLLIRGVKRVYFYALPDNPLFYSELVGDYLGDTIDAGRIDMNDAFVKVIFSKWDNMALERAVGTERVRTMLNERAGDTFDFR